MNKFEKEYYIDRLNTGSAKWDGLKGMFGETGLLPMWVADMDFRSPECVTDALKAYILSGDYGYRMPPTTH
ncbi:MAG: aminotransferase, partial [Clostridiales bacterium]|nr:aminotransferase [Clostridiales bacterium]